MAIINFGSINIDHVYRVARMPAPGETLTVKSYDRFLGGKGANQSIAIAKSGGLVRHVGAIGPDGGWAAEKLQEAGVDPGHLTVVDEPTGHAVILVDDAGENQIVICAGANRCLTIDQIAAELDTANAEDKWVLLQNETNCTSDIVRCAKAAGFRVAYSAAPFVAEETLPLVDSVDLLIVNDVEAKALAVAGGSSMSDMACAELLITRGEHGAEFHHSGSIFKQAAFGVTPVDTTGAGDTFLGAFLARYSQGGDAGEALQFAAAASAIQVTRPGAADAIPDEGEVMNFLSERKS